LKQVKKAVSGKKCDGFFSYINEIENLKGAKSGAKTAEEFCTLDHLD
jgi:hypothetical protein